MLNSAKNQLCQEKLRQNAAALSGKERENMLGVETGEPEAALQQQSCEGGVRLERKVTAYESSERLRREDDVVWAKLRATFSDAWSGGEGGGCTALLLLLGCFLYRAIKDAVITRTCPTDYGVLPVSATAATASLGVAEPDKEAAAPSEP